MNRHSGMRERLHAEERQTRELMSSLGADIRALVDARQDANSDDEHDPEGVTLAYERSQSDALLRQSRDRLADIRAAQARLDAGTFGVCVECGEPVPAARLEVRPYAETCVGCASA